MNRNYKLLAILLFFLTIGSNILLGQGVTTASINGFVFNQDGNALPGANVIAVHEPSGTKYGAATRENGVFNLPNLKIGGPYTITASFIGFNTYSEANIFLNIGQTLKFDIELVDESVELGELVVTGETDNILNSARTGAETSINPDEVLALPSIKRSTRDLTRLDPRSDGNFSFGGKNWLFNNVSVDGSYFNNPFGLDDPSPGGQTNAEPLPYDAIEQVQVSLAPFDVREGGFTGAGINTVTKSGTNEYKGSLYTFYRNESMQGDKVGDIKLNLPDLSYNQYGFTVSGPIIKNKLFFFINGEIERRTDPGTNFSADAGGDLTATESRVTVSQMDEIRQRMISEYGYDPGLYQGFDHKTENEKILIKLDWNINDNNNLVFRYNYLDARQEKPPHPFAISYNNTGRGPNQNSLPFQNSGYEMNNQLSSFALELNSRYQNFSNKFFISYNRFRDFREPFSDPFPTIEIGEGGLTYTTIGHEPFSINNILDQDVLQITNNFSYYLGNHVLTVGATYEYFDFFNSFNLFRFGFMGFNTWPGQTTFTSVQAFLDATDPTNPDQANFASFITPESIPFKGEFIEVGQLSFYAQDEFLMSSDFSLTYGLRVDIPTYLTDPVDNPWSRGLNLLDENDNPEKVDQSKLPDATPLFSPRVGFNWDVKGDRSLQIRGGTGIFTGRIPFVWVGNNISNPGANPNLYPSVNPSVSDPNAIVPPDEIYETQDNSVLMQSGDLNAMDDDFKWPQVWTTNLAVDFTLPQDIIATVEAIYSKDINSIYVRNADLGLPTGTLADGRPVYNSVADPNNFPFGGGAYIIDNSDKGYNFNITTQLRKKFDFGLSTSLSYSFLNAKNLMSTTEIASVLFQTNPIQKDPNNPELSYSQFGQRHRIIGGATYKHEWNENLATTFGLFMEIAEGNTFTTSGGNRYSFIYAGDVNGDLSGGNDLIFIPENPNDINLADPSQWDALNAFIEQDDYLSEHRGEIAERSGLVNPWYINLDLRILQDFTIKAFGKDNTFQLSLDILNFPNLISSSWGVRQVASAAATSPLSTVLDENGLVQYNSENQPLVSFNGVQETFVDDPSLFSRWQMQIGLRYMFN